jgi:hypothetical protein
VTYINGTNLWGYAEEGEVSNRTFSREETAFNVHTSEFHCITKRKELCFSDVGQFSFDSFNN